MPQMEERFLKRVTEAKDVRESLLNPQEHDEGEIVEEGEGWGE